MKRPGDVKTKPPTQALAAQNAPRLGQRSKSPYQRFLHSQKTQYGNVSPSYNVGRTRRQA